MGETVSEGKEKSEAERMAQIIDKGLGNPVSRKILNFIAKRKNGERRAEKILKAYAGMEVDLSLGDKFASFLVSRLLDSFANGTDITKEGIKSNLRDGYWRKGLASTLEGLAWRGPEKPFVSYAPFLVVWNFTNACNLDCRHCYQSADKPTPDELTTEEAKRAVDEMAKAGVGYIAFSGGEPLFRKDFFEIAEYVREQEMGLAVATNGTTLSKKNVSRLEDLDCLYFQISLDGKEETHNKMRGPNAYERTIEGIKNAVESNITVGIAMTVISENFDEVDDVINLTEEIGADIFMHYNFIPTGRGEDIAELDITPEQREELLMKLASESRKRDINMLSTAPQYGRVAARGGTLSLTHFDVASQKGMGEEIEFLADFVGGCGCGRLYWALQPNGDLTPCVFFPKTIGNIKKDSFLDIWQNSPTMESARNREKFIGNCRNCDSRNICGGCRARAYSYFNDIREDDPGCILNKDRWDEII